jgi:hypothetical protein
MRNNKTYNNEEKPYLNKNEVYLLSPNFKLASKQKYKSEKETLYFYYTK